MVIGGAPRVVLPKTDYLFVDAACLEYAMRRFGRDFFDDESIPLGHERLQAGPLGSFDKVFYYDALPIREENEDEAVWLERTASKRQILEKVESLDRFHVFEGDVRHKGGGRKQSRGQKKVDVGISVDMLTHAFRKNMDRATLIAGDIDFAPLLTALASEGMPVTLWHPENTTAELKRAAHIRRLLGSNVLWQLASAEFLEQNPYPHTMSVSFPGIRGGSCMGEWQEPNGDKYSLIERNGFFVVSKFAGTNFLEMRTRSLRALLLHCQEASELNVPSELFRYVGMEASANSQERARGAGS